MKNKLSLFVLFLGLILQTSCNKQIVNPSKSIETKSYATSKFNELTIANDFEAYVIFSPSVETLEIKANSNLFDKITVDFSGNKLDVRLKNNVIVTGNETLKVYITTNSIKTFKAYSDSKIILEDPIDVSIATIELNSDSYFEGEINADNLVFDAKSDSNALIFGTIENIDASLSADSQLEGYDLITEDLEINLFADSDAFLSVSKTIDVEAAADSKLYYKGDAEIIRQKLSGDSKIIKKD